VSARRLLIALARCWVEAARAWREVWRSASDAGDRLTAIDRRARR
jgi:hypothetical protein